MWGFINKTKATTPSDLYKTGSLGLTGWILQDCSPDSPGTPDATILLLDVLVSILETAHRQHLERVGPFKNTWKVI